MKESRTGSVAGEGLASPPIATVQLPLPLWDAVTTVREGFFALCLATGQQVLAALMEHDRQQLCGPKNVPNPQRTAYRAGSITGEVTLGGRRVPVRRLRARRVDGGELDLPSFAFAAARDPLNARTLEAIALGVATRKYSRSLDPLPTGLRERSVSKSAVSRRFVALSATRLTAWLAQPLGGLDVRIIVIDGLHFREHVVLLALGVDSTGQKHVLTLREGSTENAAVCRALLTDLRERGLDLDRPVLFIVDGAPALRKAIRAACPLAVLHRCQIHKRRNVLEHLPEAMRPSVQRALDEAYHLPDAALAERRLERLAAGLEAEHPGAAHSLREGLADTLTLQRLGISGALYRTLRSTNMIENLNGLVGHFTRNVRRWRNGGMLVRWIGAAIHDAHGRFRKLRGHRDLAALVQALDRIVMDSRKEVA